MKKKRRRGGQRKPAAQRKRKSLTFRIRDNLRAQLEKAAIDAERSVSEETEHRLIMSFREQGIAEIIKQAVAEAVGTAAAHGDAKAAGKAVTNPTKRTE